jgi:hypothetical protein
MLRESNDCDAPSGAAQNTSTTSFFEFWPTWVMYLPVVVQWVWLAIRYRSITLPFIANPKLTLAGMVGVGKSELMQQATDECKKAILPWTLHHVNGTSSAEQAKQWLVQIQRKDIDFPFVCKPDIGCRGSGVKLIENLKQLADCIQSYPQGSALLAQKLASFEPEVGIFFVRYPDQSKGEIVSLTLKSSPYVVGDGHHTLCELVAKDERAGSLLSLYSERHKDNWHKVIEKGLHYRLVFSASHCRGAVFTDINSSINQALTDSINDIMAGLPEFYYGRLDVKFSNPEQLRAGKDLQIVEINGASAESIHIWDRRATFKDAVKTLMWQYQTLFFIGNQNRQQGYKTPGLRSFLKHWRIEKRLAKHYPLTD